MRSGASTNGVPCEPLAARAREEAGAVLQSASERHCRTHQKRHFSAQRHERHRTRFAHNGKMRLLKKMAPLPSTARSMMVGRVFLVLTGACQFGHGVGGFTTNFIHSFAVFFRGPELRGVWHEGAYDTPASRTLVLP